MILMMSEHHINVYYKSLESNVWKEFGGTQGFRIPKITSIYQVAAKVPVPPASVLVESQNQWCVNQACAN